LNNSVLKLEMDWILNVWLRNVLIAILQFFVTIFTTMIIYR